jgi:hypothetical protein
MQSVADFLKTAMKLPCTLEPTGQTSRSLVLANAEDE